MNWYKPLNLIDFIKEKPMTEEERLRYARIGREITKANTEELLKVNNFNSPSL